MQLLCRHDGVDNPKLQDVLLHWGEEIILVQCVRRIGESAISTLWTVRCRAPTIRQRFQFDPLERGPARRKHRLIGGTTTGAGADEWFVAHPATSWFVRPIDPRLMALDECSLERADSILGAKVTGFNAPARCRRSFITHRPPQRVACILVGANASP